jgi:hypothetical protein
MAAAAALARRADGPAFREAVLAALASDKKRQGGEILMALPRAPGAVGIEAIPLAELRSFVMEAP